MKSADEKKPKKSFMYNLYRGRLFRILKSSSPNSTKVAGFLKKYPELVYEKDRNGNSPLHLALMQSKGEVNKSVEAILGFHNKGILQTQNEQGFTPADVILAYHIMSSKVTAADIVEAIDGNPNLKNFKDRNKKSLFADDLKRNKGFTDKDVYHAYKAKAMLEKGDFTQLGDFITKESPNGEEIKFLEFVDSKGEKLFAKELQQNKGLSTDNIALEYQLIASINRGGAPVIGILGSIPQLANFQDRDGNTLAHHVITSENLLADKIVGFLKDLKEKGVGLNKQNAQGETILHTLAKSGKYSQELLSDLVNLGANHDIKDGEGKSAADIVTARSKARAAEAESQSTESPGRFTKAIAAQKQQHQGGTPARVVQPQQKEKETSAQAVKVEKPSTLRKLKIFLGFSSAKSTSIPSYKYPPEHNRKGEIGYRSKSGDTIIL